MVHQPSEQAVLAFWNEQRQQLRQSEDQRSTLTNYILVLATAVTGLIVQQKFASRTWPLALLLAVLGCYGAVASAKYHERAEYHLTQARAFTQALIGLGALPDSAALDSRRSTHYAKYPWLHRLRLHWLWTGLHFAIGCYGAGLLAAVLTG